MDIERPFDFKEFLKLLNEKGVRYLLIRGYAARYHAHPREVVASPQGVAISSSPCGHLFASVEQSSTVRTGVGQFPRDGQTPDAGIGRYIGCDLD